MESVEEHLRGRPMPHVGADDDDRPPGESMGPSLDELPPGETAAPTVAVTALLPARNPVSGGLQQSMPLGAEASPVVLIDDSGLDDDEALALLEGAAGGSRGSKKPNKRLQKKHQKEKERKQALKSAPSSDGASPASTIAAAPSTVIEVEYSSADVAKQLKESAKESGDETLAAFADIFSSFNRLAGRSSGVSAAQAAAGFVAVGEDGKLKTEAEVEKERREQERLRRAAEGDDDDDDGSDLDDDDLLSYRDGARLRRRKALRSKGKDDNEDDDGETDENGDGGANGESRLSRKQRKAALMASLPELKRSVAHPEVVEANDVFSSDPHLLAHLKSFRNAVPVPRHWCKKSRYLQRSKVGTEKPPFTLPTFIADTGITKLRNADLEAADEKTLKAKQRDRYVPKMGRIEIEYTVLHDAFFKYQTKPKLCGFGDLYYEGRELEAAKTAAAHYAATKKPGIIGDRLREALGMPLGVTVAPPWLTKMQQYGPPPSYPRLLIPGVNAPLPAGASYGMLPPAGWGRPPCDQFGTPLYGNVFGPPEEAPMTYSAALSTPASASQGQGGNAAPALPSIPAASASSGPKRVLWGDLGSGVGGVPGVTRGAGANIIKPTAGTASAAGGAGGGAASGAGDAGAIADGTATPALSVAGSTADGAASVAPSSFLGGIETPADLDLRKGRRAPGAAPSIAGIDTPSSIAPPSGPQAPPPQLFQVLEQRQTGLQGGLLATTHAYVIPKAGEAGPAAPASLVSASSSALGRVAGDSGAGDGVAIAVAPEELERMDASAIAQRYQQEVASAANSKVEALRVAKGIGKEGVDEVIEEHERKRSRKEAGLDKGGAGGTKSKRAAKDFKF